MSDYYLHLKSGLLLLRQSAPSGDQRTGVAVIRLGKGIEVARKGTTLILESPGGSSVAVVDALDSASPADALSANMGRELDERKLDRIGGDASALTLDGEEIATQRWVRERSGIYLPNPSCIVDGDNGNDDAARAAYLTDDYGTEAKAFKTIQAACNFVKQCGWNNNEAVTLRVKKSVNPYARVAVVGGGARINLNAFDPANKPTIQATSGQYACASTEGGSLRLNNIILNSNGSYCADAAYCGEIGLTGCELYGAQTTHTIRAYSQSDVRMYDCHFNVTGSVQFMVTYNSSHMQIGTGNTFGSNFRCSRWFYSQGDGFLYISADYSGVSLSITDIVSYAHNNGGRPFVANTAYLPKKK